jgi:hypothetical protein
MDIQKLIYAISLIIINTVIISKFIDTTLNVFKFTGVMIFYYLLVIGFGYLGATYASNEMVGTIVGMVISVYLWVNFGKKISTSS